MEQIRQNLPCRFSHTNFLKHRNPGSKGLDSDWNVLFLSVIFSNINYTEGLLYAFSFSQCVLVLTACVPTAVSLANWIYCTYTKFSTYKIKGLRSLLYKIKITLQGPK